MTPKPIDPPPSPDHILAFGGPFEGQWYPRDRAGERGVMFLEQYGSSSRTTEVTYMLQTVAVGCGLSIELYVWSDINEPQVMSRLRARWGVVMTAMRPSTKKGE